MKFFTADNHFHHAGIIHSCDRPFKTVEQMNAYMIRCWNEAVRPGDVVYHLGDFAYRGNASEIEALITQLNGTIHLIKGNHDDKSRWMEDLYKRMFAKVSDISYIKIDGQKIFLSHYAHRTWRASCHGSWHLYGHSHGTMPPYGKSFDVGVDVWNFTPVSFYEVQEKMKTLAMKEE